MPDEYEREIIENWLRKCDVALVATQKNIDLDLLETAQNRVYYAVFYAVSALAKSRNFVTAKHGQLLGWFNREYVKTELIEKKLAEIYQNSFEFRQKCDYTFFYKPTREKLELDLSEATRLIARIKNLLNV